MYYEEKVIDGILCCRYSSSAEWHQFTQEELTRKYIEANERFILWKDRAEEAKK
jgi:hypothetical protein